MRIRSLLFLICSIVNLSVFALPAMKQSPGKTVVIATSEWRPYVQEDANYHGYAYETVVAAFKAAGYQPKIVFMSWAEADAKLQKGEVDAFFPAYLIKNRKGYVKYSQPFSGGPLGFYHLRGKDIQVNADLVERDQWRLFGGLSKYKFGAVRHYSYLPAFDENKQIQKRYVLTDAQNLDQLLDKTVDVILMDKYVATYYLKNKYSQAQAKQVQFVEPPLAYKQLYLSVPRSRANHLDVLAAFNHGLATINQNGELSNILHKDTQKMGIAMLD